MSRPKRLWYPNHFYHVVMRGNNRQNIFRTREDVHAFFDILAQVHEKYPFTIISYCIMTNHYHLLIRSPYVPLSKIMMLVNKRYSEYYKATYSFSGHLYEKRYYADIIKTALGVLEVSRYIHKNPIQTKVPIVSCMEHYPHSSYALYKGNKPSPYIFIDTSILPTYFTLPEQRNFRFLCAFTEGLEEVYLYK